MSEHQPARRAEDYLDTKSLANSIVRSQDWGRVHLAGGGDDPLRPTKKKKKYKGPSKLAILALGFVAVLLTIAYQGYRGFDWFLEQSASKPLVATDIFPQNYRDCLAYQDHPISQRGNYACEIRVESSDIQMINACEAVGGEIEILGDSRDDRQGCRLVYYREDLVMPTRYDECVLQAEGDRPLNTPSIPSCLIEINAQRAYKTPHVGDLLKNCPAESAVYEENHRCQVVFAASSLSLPQNYIDCLLSGGDVQGNSQSQICEVRYTVSDSQDYSGIYVNATVEGDLFEECWFGQGHPSINDRGVQICALRFDYQSGEVIAFAGEKEALPSTSDDEISIEFDQIANRIVSDAMIVSVSASSSLSGAISEESITLEVIGTELIVQGTSLSLENAPDGQIRIQATATGANGTSATDTLDLVVDRGLPQISRAEIIGCSQNTAQIQIEANDLETVIADVLIFEPQNQTPILSQRAIGEEVVVSDFEYQVGGVMQLTVIVQDGAGNQVSQNLPISCSQ